jgi:CheY-like chemotaxis protein
MLQDGAWTYLLLHKESRIFGSVPTERRLEILLVEDNRDDVFFFENAFKKAGANGRLKAVADGKEALAYLTSEGIYSDRVNYPFPDVVLLDLNMPRMNGFEVLEWIRRDRNCGRLIVHVLTSSCREADVQRAYDLHANGYVVKPSRLEQLVAFVTALQEWHRFVVVPTNEDCAIAESHVIA